MHQLILHAGLLPISLLPLYSAGRKWSSLSFSGERQPLGANGNRLGLLQASAPLAPIIRENAKTASVLTAMRDLGSYRPLPVFWSWQFLHNGCQLFSSQNSARSPPVRDDVVHDRGRREDATRQAVCAQGMALQEALPCPAPFGVIAAFGGAARKRSGDPALCSRAVCAASRTGWGSPDSGRDVWAFRHRFSSLRCVV